MSGFSADWLRLREPFDTAAREASLLAPAGGGKPTPRGAEVAATDRSAPGNALPDWRQGRGEATASDRSALGNALSDWRRGRGELAVLDLGAGTGANFRFLAPRLGGTQRWILVDHDPALLGKALEVTRAWALAAGLAAASWGDGLRLLQVADLRTAPRMLAADSDDDGDGDGDGDGLRLRGAGLDCRVELLRLDLARDLERLPLGGRDLVATSALLDLVSASWLDRLLARVRGQGSAFVAALTYDGRIGWDPADPEDRRLRALVNRHQRTDKGFGPALGPDAAGQAAALLRSSGYRVVTAASDWQLGPSDREIQRALLDGWVAAAGDMDPTAQAWAGRWRARRLDLIDAGRSRLTVGHQDLFGSP